MIHIKAQAKASGELMDGLIASPASLAFIKLGNAQWRAKTGQNLILAPPKIC
jgi:hypothetical protein